MQRAPSPTVLAPPISVEPVLPLPTREPPSPQAPASGVPCPWGIPPDDPEDHEPGCPVRREAERRRRVA